MLAGELRQWVQTLAKTNNYQVTARIRSNDDSHFGHNNDETEAERSSLCPIQWSGEEQGNIDVSGCIAMFAMTGYWQKSPPAIVWANGQIWYKIPIELPLDNIAGKFGTKIPWSESERILICKNSEQNKIPPEEVEKYMEIELIIDAHTREASAHWLAKPHDDSSEDDESNEETDIDHKSDSSAPFTPPICPAPWSEFDVTDIDKGHEQNVPCVTGYFNENAILYMFGLRAVFNVESEALRWSNGEMWYRICDGDHGID